MSSSLIWWREENEVPLSMIPFKTQISWVEESELLDTELEDDFTIGMIYRGHANFSDILESVLERNPDAKFHFWSRTVEYLLEGRCPGTDGATISEVTLVDEIKFGLNTVSSSIVGLFGLIGNVFAAYILGRSRRLRSRFNCFLAVLLHVNVFYLICVLLTECYKQMKETQALHQLFIYFFHPMTSMLNYTSTALTVLLARERFCAIKYPFQYRSSSSRGNPWKRAFLFTLGISTFFSVFVTPNMFEVRVVKIPSPEDNGTEVDRLQGTALRSNKSYIFWYRNVSNFSMTLFLPLCLLLFYNISTYVLMKKRFANIASSAGAISEANNNPSASANGFVNNNNNNYNSNSGKPSILRAIKKEEDKNAMVLLGIVVVFAACNTLRFINIMEEIVSGHDHSRFHRLGCNSLPFWKLTVNRVSQFLLVFNASLTSVVYCITSKDFRNEAVATLISCFSSTARNSQPSSQRMEMNLDLGGHGRGRSRRSGGGSGSGRRSRRNTPNNNDDRGQTRSASINFDHRRASPWNNNEHDGLRISTSMPTSLKNPAMTLTPMNNLTVTAQINELDDNGHSTATTEFNRSSSSYGGKRCGLFFEWRPPSNSGLRRFIRSNKPPASAFV